MRASVIVPTYGHRPGYLRDALLSVRAQSLSGDEYEILVVDNTPTGTVVDIVEGLNRNGEHYVRYTHEPVVGLHNARHAGAREGRGDILVYIDDDVIAHQNWLKALLEPFHDPRVGCAGGKVIPMWEVDPPGWYTQFNSGYLSLLDLGEESRELRWPACVWGCNMAVRRNVIYSLGGFNPDALGDRRLIWLRGDGECGLQEKIYNSGLRVVYEPQAWVYHRIPASRLTPEHLYWRFFIQGIQDSYTRIRAMDGCQSFTLRLLGYASFCFLKTCWKYMRSLMYHENRVRLRADAWLWYGKGQHQVRTALSRRLRRHVLRESYL